VKTVKNTLFQAKNGPFYSDKRVGFFLAPRIIKL
jgi:hypothetical protein